MDPCIRVFYVVGTIIGLAWFIALQTYFVNYTCYGAKDDLKQFFGSIGFSVILVAAGFAFGLPWGSYFYPNDTLEAEAPRERADGAFAD